MRFLIFCLLCFIGLTTLLGFSFWGSAAIAIWVYYAWIFFHRSNDTLAFREFILVLYGLNFLLSPALVYTSNDSGAIYRMRIPEEEYFQIAIPSILLLRLGLFAVKTQMFSIRFGLVKMQAGLNQDILKNWLFIGIAATLLKGFMPGELGFLVYLISSIRYVAAFGLFALNRRKYKWHILTVLFIELSYAVSQGMFHDIMMWLIFFGIYWIYLIKPSRWKKIGLAAVAVLAFFILQISKGEYRQKTWVEGEKGDFETFSEVASKNLSGDQLFGQEHVSGSLTRVNQAWILSSTVNQMNKIKDWQGLTLVGLYIEAAILPRVLAPNKLTSGNKEIFNRFSGHHIREGTSMGLGVLADGYIAFGYWGVLIFSFALGLIFCAVFKIVEGWTRISPFFVFFIFPILNYAVRPDCETQTIIGHMVKALIVFGIMMSVYRKYFSRRIYLMRKQEERIGKKDIETGIASTV